MSGKKHFLIVGFGSVGRRHFNNIKKVAPDLRVVILRTSKKLSEEERKVEGAFLVTDSFDEVISLDLLGAIVATPAPFHLSVAEKLVKHQIPVLVEKPLSQDLEQTRSFSEVLSGNSSQVFMVGYNFRFSKTANHLKALVEKGVIGKVLSSSLHMGFYLPSWRPEQDYKTVVSARKDLGGGALLELSHALDLYLWFFGMPTNVFAKVRKLSDLQIDTDDNVDLILESEENRMVSRIHLDMLQRKAARKFEIVGSEGTLIWDMVNNSVNLLKLNSEEELTLKEGEEWNEMYIHEIEHFLACTQGQSTPKVTYQDGLNVMKLVEASLRSSASARAVVIVENAL